jgi:DNA-binding response OmpR family regulator
MTRVLLLNDNESIMDKTARLLEDMGWEVHSASSRKTALWKCVARRPRMVIIDIEMRGGAGLESISTIRRTDKSLFILAATRGSRDKTLLKVAKICGANDHVIGPVSAAKLFAAIEAGRASGFLQARPQ